MFIHTYAHFWGCPQFFINFVFLYFYLWTHHITKPCSLFNQGNRTHQYMLEPICCLPSKPLLPCNLTHNHYDVRQGIGPQLTRVVNYAHFALNKFGVLSITHWYYDALLFHHIQPCFPHIVDQTQPFRTFLSQPKMCTLNCKFRDRSSWKSRGSSSLLHMLCEK